MILTSRWLGYKAEEFINADFEHFMLQDLDQDQINDFIQRRNWPFSETLRR